MTIHQNHTLQYDMKVATEDMKVVMAVTVVMVVIKS
jgi:hypothetical protein